LNKISKSGQGQHSAYSVVTDITGKYSELCVQYTVVVRRGVDKLLTAAYC
jgi:hypothetical protein